ncbi:MAG: HisA/HisF-related TIM barrel protein [Myxococcota bacterium]
MIVPSIDLRHGQAVQLVGGETPALEAGDPIPLARGFGVVGPIAVIDLGAALGDDVQHADQIAELCQIARCRVGGGLRTVDKAKAWLDRGADQVIIGTAATPEFVRQLPKERVIVALDAVEGEVVVDGWRTRTGRSILDGMAELRDHVGGFLVTFVEREGRLQGTDLERVKDLVETAGDARLTIAGGVSTVEEVRELDTLGADAQVGMALYTGRFTIGQAVAGLLTSDRPDGLFPTVVADDSGVALGLAYSSCRRSA